jgi:molecular chaperone Hsp33
MDTLIHALLNGEAAVYACDISQMAEEARKTHGAWPIATMALGRTLAGCTLMSAMLKTKRDRITLSINGGGPAGTIMAVGDAELHIKGYIANPQVNIPPSENGSLDIAGAVGKNGLVTVIRDQGLKDPYIGKTPIQTGEIAEDIAYYMLQSEQQPSIVYLNTWVEQDLTVLNAGGIIIAPMPGCSEKTLSDIESRLWDIKNYALHLMQYTPEQEVMRIFSGMDVKVLREDKPVYVCDCSLDRITGMLLALGTTELRDMLEKDKGAQITCRFCNKEYNLNEQDLNMIIEKAMELKE